MRKRYVMPEVRAMEMMEEVMQSTSVDSNLPKGEEISQGSGSGEPGRSREAFCLWEEE